MCCTGHCAHHLVHSLPEGLLLWTLMRLGTCWTGCCTDGGKAMAAPCVLSVL